MWYVVRSTRHPKPQHGIHVHVIKINLWPTRVHVPVLYSILSYIHVHVPYIFMYVVLVLVLG